MGFDFQEDFFIGVRVILDVGVRQEDVERFLAQGTFPWVLHA